MEKKTVIIIAMALMVGLVGLLPLREVKADAGYVEVIPQVMTSLVGFEATASPIWSTPELKPTDDSYAQYFAKFTITERSVYAFSCKMATAGAHETDANCYLSTLPDCGTWISASNYLDSIPIYGVLEPGTYYLKITSGLSGICKHQVNVYLGIIPYDQAITLT